MKSFRGYRLGSSGLNTISLALLLVIPLLSVSSDPNHISTLQFATIDATATKVNIKGNEYVGLPDPYDFSKHKTIYYMFLLNYCSGYKRPGSDKPVIDFCSKRGHELWDILASWQMWGVSVRPDGSAKFDWLRKGPHWLYIVYLTAIVMLAVNILGSFAMLHRWRRGKSVLFAMSVVTACVVLAVAISCQVTYGTLVARADDDKVSITAYLGKPVYAVIWIAAACSLCASILSFLYSRKDTAGKKKESVKPNLSTFASKGTSYKYETVTLGTEFKVSSVANSRDPSMERLRSRNGSTDSLERGRGEERPYDPFLAPRGYSDRRVASKSRSRSPAQLRLHVEDEGA